jgi:cobalt/nickel transport protein
MKKIVSHEWAKPALGVLAGLVVLTPIFAAGSSVVGYAEPLENAAEITGASEEAVLLNPGVLPDYSVPGLGMASGTLISAIVGTAATLVVTIGYARFLE